jgi:hypothetical protein
MEADESAAMPRFPFVGATRSTAQRGVSPYNGRQVSEQA